MRGCAAALALALAACAHPPSAGIEPEPLRAPGALDVLIKDGTVYDGSGGPGRRADVGIRGDRIVAVGRIEGSARTVVDARGLAVAPGFVNMLSWAPVTLLEDGRSQSDIRQGVTTEIFGEGSSMGPINDAMRRRMIASQTDITYEVPWTTLAEYLRHLERRGVSPNVASFIGAATIRTHVLGLDDVKPTPAQMNEMRELVRKEMEAGALGIGSALIYAPGAYATTEELIELCKVAARYKGTYISHMRSESDKLVEGVEELIRISREAGLPAEIYHFKVVGQKNWDRLDQAIAAVERARGQGLRITANMYLYTASSTGLSVTIPTWAHDGGAGALYDRLRDPATRARIAAEMRARGPMSRTLFVSFRTEALRPLIGKTLEEVARARGKDEVDTTLDLVLEDRSRIGAVFFSMSEEGLRKVLRLPWVSFGSDGGSMAPEGVFLASSTHPRAYGNFARLLGTYVRDEKIVTLPEAVRRLSALPAANLGLDGRGRLAEDMFADVVAFDPATIADRATYEHPHRYAVGMRHVFVNGVQVLRDGEHTGARPGRALWGPGKTRS
jgi:N-acyl-D-amino-acid deacylase